MIRKAVVSACSAACVLACAGGVWAQGEPPAAEPAAPAPAVAPARPAALPPPEFRRTGTLQVTKDGGKVVGMKLVALSYDLVVDESTKGMENLDGKRVRIVGTFSHQSDGKRMIAVKSFEVPEEDKPAAPAAAAPAAPAAPAAAPAK